MFYCLKLSDEEKRAIVESLRVPPGFSLLSLSAPLELAARVERERGEDDLLSLSTSRLRAWYYERVRDIARDVLEEILAGHVSDLHDHLHETVDGLDLVIYTYKAKCALLASDNEDALEEETGEGGPPEVRAFWAIRADVLESLQSMVDYGPPEGVPLPEGFDLEDSSTWKAEEVQS